MIRSVSFWFLVFLAGCGASGDAAAPTISGLQSSVVAENAATITWKTDKPTDTGMEYGRTKNYGVTLPSSAEMVTTHFQIVTELKPATLYHYRALSRDAKGRLAASWDNTFTTAGSPEDSERISERMVTPKAPDETPTTVVPSATVRPSATAPPTKVSPLTTAKTTTMLRPTTTIHLTTVVRSTTTVSLTTAVVRPTTTVRPITTTAPPTTTTLKPKGAQSKPAPPSTTTVRSPTTARSTTTTVRSKMTSQTKTTIRPKAASRTTTTIRAKRKGAPTTTVRLKTIPSTTVRSATTVRAMTTTTVRSTAAVTTTTILPSAQTAPTTTTAPTSTKALVTTTTTTTTIPITTTTVPPKAQEPRDTTPPSTPGGVAAAAASSTQINVAWNPASDDVGVVGYRIYRNGVQIAALAGQIYSDNNLTPDTTYRYTVEAYDGAGNVSGQSGPATAHTPAQ